MSLRDLIREVHGPNELIPALDMYLLKRQPKFRAPGWHVSDFCGMCARAREIMTLISFQGRSWSSGARMSRVLDVGTALHSWYQNEYLGRMGVLWGKWKDLASGIIVWGFRPNDSPGTVWEYKEVPVEAALPGHSKKILGHSDGLIRLQNIWFVLEIKTINSRGFRNLVGPIYNADLQGLIYGELIRQRRVPVPYGVDIPMPTRLIVLYICKDTSEEREFGMSLDEDVAKENLRAPYHYEEAFKVRELTGRKPGCESLLDEIPSKCPVASYCFGTLTWNELENIGRK